jgi:UBX domain
MAALPDEPVTGGARIAVRLPDGRRLDRRFDGHHRIRDVFTWCISLGVRNGSFQLRLSFPKKAFTLDQDGDVTVEAAGLMPTAALNVDML